MLTSDETARRLGVKLATIYAYVSRGILVSHRSADGRRSLFDVGEVEALARRSRTGQRIEGRLATIAASVTELRPEGPVYRGVPATSLVATEPFERVADLLWQGGPGARGRGAGRPGPGDDGRRPAAVGGGDERFGRSLAFGPARRRRRAGRPDDRGHHGRVAGWTARLRFGDPAADRGEPGRPARVVSEYRHDCSCRGGARALGRPRARELDRGGQDRGVDPLGRLRRRPLPPPGDQRELPAASFQRKLPTPAGRTGRHGEPDR